MISSYTYVHLAFVMQVGHHTVHANLDYSFHLPLGMISSSCKFVFGQNVCLGHFSLFYGNEIQRKLCFPFSLLRPYSADLCKWVLPSTNRMSATRVPQKTRSWLEIFSVYTAVSLYLLCESEFFYYAWLCE